MNKMLLALVIIGAAFATEDVISTIQRIDQTTFGRTLFDSIWLQLESGEPIDRMLNTLTELEDRYTAEQKEDDASNKDFQDSCNQDISVYDQDIAESDNARIVLEAKLEGQLYPQREIFTTVVQLKQKELNAYNKEVDELDKLRAEESAEFEEKVAEHNAATTVISEARHIFTEGMKVPAGEAVFIQRGKINSKAFVTIETSTLVSKHLLASAKKMSKVSYRKSYAKIFKVLATITSRAHQVAEGGAVDRIVQLMDELLQKVSDSLDLERFAEGKRVQAHKKARNLVVISINGTQTALANATVELNSVNDQIRQAETSLENTNQRLAIKNEERTDRYTQCEEAAFDYMQSRNNRNADRSVVSETVGLVNLQLRTLKEQLALRMAAGDKFDY